MGVAKKERDIKTVGESRKISAETEEGVNLGIAGGKQVARLSSGKRVQKENIPKHEGGGRGINYIPYERGFRWRKTYSRTPPSQGQKESGG